MTATHNTNCTASNAPVLYLALELGVTKMSFIGGAVLNNVLSLGGTAIRSLGAVGVIALVAGFLFFSGLRRFAGTPKGMLAVGVVLLTALAIAWFSPKPGMAGSRGGTGGRSAAKGRLSAAHRRLRHRAVCLLPFPGQIISWCGVTSSMGRRSTPASGIRLARGGNRLPRIGPISGISRRMFRCPMAWPRSRLRNREIPGPGEFSARTRPRSFSMGLWKCVPSFRKAKAFGQPSGCMAVPRWMSWI